jgi:hypothetical protein
VLQVVRRREAGLSGTDNDGVVGVAFLHRVCRIKCAQASDVPFCS